MGGLYCKGYATVSCSTAVTVTAVGEDRKNMQKIFIGSIIIARTQLPEELGHTAAADGE